MSKLVILRGLPGSGKSTYAHKLGYLNVEGDMFRYNDKGGYEYHEHKDAMIYRMCRFLVDSTLIQGYSVIINNTHLTNKSMSHYIDTAEALGITIEIHELKGEYESQHGVSRDVMESMANTWEELKDEWRKYRV